MLHSFMKFIEHLVSNMEFKNASMKQVRLVSIHDELRIISINSNLSWEIYPLNKIKFTI